MRGHTGSFMTMGEEGAYVESSKHKLNTKSSTEADLVGVYDVLTQVIWNRYFLKEQVYMTHDPISDKIIPDIYVPRPLAARSLTIII